MEYICGDVRVYITMQCVWIYFICFQDDFIERREPAQIPEEHFGHRFVLTCKQLRLDMEIEPIFATVSLYDAKERKKISENFYFDMIQEPVKKLLEMHIPYQDVSTLSRSCIFSVTYPSPDIFIVIKVNILEALKMVLLILVRIYFTSSILRTN